MILEPRYKAKFIDRRSIIITKSHVVVEASIMERAKDVLKNLGNDVVDRSRVLGYVVGADVERAKLFETKSEHSEIFEKMWALAKTARQSVYKSITNSLQQ